MNSHFKTIILRFRDLVTAESQTINLHREKKDDSDHVWWGWWAKQGEKVPIKSFSTINTKITQQGFLKIYLFDTGRHKLYEAKCNRIKYSDDGVKQETPSKENTPAYYSHNKYLAWFKFSSITEIQDQSVPDVLHRHSYVEIAELYSDEQKRFEPFENKIISSLEELRHQEKTIWFLRDSKTTDSKQEILLYDTPEIKPEHFIKNFRTKRGNSILWLSDLHFGEDHGYNSEAQATSNDKPLWVLIRDAIEELKYDISGLIISGDLTTKAAEEGFNHSSQLISKLCSDFSISNYDTIICPGNHDFGMNEGDDGETESTIVEKLNTEEYRRLYKELYYLEPNKHYCSGRRYLLNNKYSVEIISVNSNLLQQERSTFQGYGFVGDEQLEFCSGEYNFQDRNEFPTRILVMHHHLLPVSYTENTDKNSRYSLSLDAESIIRWCLKNNIKMVLHGHMHQPHMVEINRPILINNGQDWRKLFICGLGSSGSKRDLLGEYSNNTFGILTFKDGNINTEIYALNPTGTFRTDPIVNRSICL